jgi:putative ABC transport system ATP-binding protein
LLVGPSGCDKTTLLSISGAMLEPDGVECEVMGRDPADMGTRGRAPVRGESIGFVFQGFNLLPTLAAEENVAVPLLIGGAPVAGRVPQINVRPVSSPRAMC